METRQHRQLGRRGGGCLLLIQCGLFSLASMSCRKSHTSVNGLDVNQAITDGQKAPATSPSATPVPIEIDNGLTIPRTYVQTRGIIGLSVAIPAAANGDHLSLLDETTGATLIDESISGLGLDSASETLSHQVFLTAGNLLLGLYPSDPTLLAKLTYGENRLHLLVEHAGTEDSAHSRVVLADFSYQDVSGSSFPGGSERQGGLEAEVSWLNTGVVGNGSGELTTGRISVLSR
jgi:hypothetical protein